MELLLPPCKSSDYQNMRAFAKMREASLKTREAFPNAVLLNAKKARESVLHEAIA